MYARISAVQSLVCYLVLMTVGLLNSPARAATGPEVEELAAFDALMNRLMAEWKIPGGALAVTKNGRLVLARGYGWADREAQRPARPTSPFRIASLSKQITSVAVLRLAEQRHQHPVDPRPQRPLLCRAVQRSPQKSAHPPHGPRPRSLASQPRS